MIEDRSIIILSMNKGSIAGWTGWVAALDFRIALGVAAVYIGS